MDEFDDLRAWAENQGVMPSNLERDVRTLLLAHDAFRSKIDTDDKGLWILTEDEHDRLAASAWYNYHVSRTVPVGTVWGNVPDDEKAAWRNAVAGVLFSLSDKHGLDAVVIDY